jgi:hypothetical protein
MKIFTTTLLILSLFLFSFCKNSNTTGNEARQNVAAANKSDVNIPQWHFVTKEDTLGNPQTVVYLVVRDTQKIAQATAAFRVLEQPEYEEKKLPPNVKSACSGFWAGIDNLFIVVDSADTWVVKAKYEDEEAEEPAQFEIVKVFKK